MKTFEKLAQVEKIISPLTVCLSIYTSKKNTSWLRKVWLDNGGSMQIQKSFDKYILQET